MDPDLDPDEAMRRRMEEVSRSLRNPNPHKQLRRLLYEPVEHLAVTDEAFWLLGGRLGKPLKNRPMHPALTKVVAPKRDEDSGKVMRDPSPREATACGLEEVLHFGLPNPGNDLYGQSAC